MKAWFLSAVALVSLIASSAVGYVLITGEVLELRANEALVVVQNPIHPGTGDNVVRRLRKGETLPVLGCDDFKSDFLVRVDVGGDRSGYVGAGDYGLKRSPASLGTVVREPSRVVISCHDLLLHRTVDE